jgi:hypothetical protein
MSENSELSIHGSGISQSTGSNKIGVPAFLPEVEERSILQTVVIF